MRNGFSLARVDEVLAKNGKLTWGEMLRRRVRYFTDGAVLGSKEFVNTIVTAERQRFGPQRKRGRSVGPPHSLSPLRAPAVPGAAW